MDFVFDIDENALKRRYTMEEYLQLPEGPPYYELDDGELVEVKSTHGDHGIWMGRLFAYLDTWARQKGGKAFQEAGTILTQQKGYIPDVIFLFSEHLDRYQGGRIQGNPDLVVEIHNREGARRDRVKKFNTYQERGVPWYWILDYEGAVLEEFHLEDGRYVRTSAAGLGDDFQPQALPGLVIAIASLI